MKIQQGITTDFNPAYGGERPFPYLAPLLAFARRRPRLFLTTLRLCKCQRWQLTRSCHSMLATETWQVIAC